MLRSRSPVFGLETSKRVRRSEDFQVAADERDDNAHDTIEDKADDDVETFGDIISPSTSSSALTAYTINLSAIRTFPELTCDHCYVSDFFARPSQIYSALRKEITFRQEKTRFLGKIFDQPRLTALCTESAESYFYSGFKRVGTPMTPTVKLVTEAVNAFIRVKYPFHPQFTTAIANYYENGDKYIAAHADNEKTFDDNCVIAAVSFGAERFFDISSIATRQKVLRLPLKSGSLFIMGATFQQLYKHSIPKQKLIKTGRISLTFRISKKV